MLKVIVLQHLDKPHVIVRETALVITLLREIELNLEPIPDTPLIRKETTALVKNISLLVKKKSDLTVGVY